MLYNEENKELMYKWRKENKEKYNEIVRKGQAKYKSQHREEVNQKELDRYYQKKFFNVEIEIKRLSNLYKIYE